MSPVPVRAASRPLIDLLSDAVLALLAPREPAEPRMRRRTPVRPAAERGFERLDVPTYLRRGLRIAGLEGEPEPGPDRGHADGKAAGRPR